MARASRGAANHRNAASKAVQGKMGDAMAKASRTAPGNESSQTTHRKSPLPHFSYGLPISFSKFPPDASSLSSLGFDSASIGKHEAILRKNHSFDIFGNPSVFSEIRLRKDSATVVFSSDAEKEAGMRRLQATVLLLRLLLICPQAKADAGALSKFLLPAIELSANALASNAGRIYSELSESQTEAHLLAAKNRQLSRKAGEAELAAAGLELRASSLAERIKKLESVSNAALEVMALDWLSSHKGSFNPVLFAKAHTLPPARAEEGLQALLSKGLVRKIDSRFFIGKPLQADYYANAGAREKLSAALSRFSRGFFGRQQK